LFFQKSSLFLPKSWPKYMNITQNFVGKNVT
jgi:hypothetical protein